MLYLIGAHFKWILNVIRMEYVCLLNRIASSISVLHACNYNQGSFSLFEVQEA